MKATLFKIVAPVTVICFPLARHNGYMSEISDMCNCKWNKYKTPSTWTSVRGMNKIYDCVVRDLLNERSRQQRPRAMGLNLVAIARV